MNIIIGADFVPTKSNEVQFINGDIKQLVDEKIYNLVSSADFSIFNLEVPLTDTETPINKCGPNLIAKIDTINGYKALGVKFFTLSNNHILDQGEQGLLSTIDVLDKAEVAYAGAGKNLDDAAKPYVFKFNNKNVGIYCCAENEFSIATKTSGGANPFDPLESLDHISKLKNECDFVIVLYHGGKEHYRYPSPNLQKICRKIVDKGADLVVCQHSHCIGCEEKYNNGTIVYGQGNFLFDYSNNEFWQTSLLIQLDENYNISYIPLKKNGNGVVLADENSKNKILDNFFLRSEEIKDNNFIEKKYKEFSNEMLEFYLFLISTIKRGLLFRIVNKLSGYRYVKWLLRKKYNNKKLLVIRNFLECEAHRELFLKGIKID